MGQLSESLADLVCADWRGRIDATSREIMTTIVRTAFVDTAACILAGRTEAPTQVTALWAHQRFVAATDSSVLFTQQRMKSAGAALINGVAGHALDYDGVALAGHPSVVLMPALWAEYERLGTGGFDLVQGYAKGYGVWAEMARRHSTSLHEHGWHPTAVFGVVAAAAAVAGLRGLSKETTSHAIGIAASLSSGVIANFGSMTKPMHAGRAAEGGITAVELALAGLTSSPDALEGPAGLLRALSGGHPVNLAGPCAGDTASTLLRVRPGIKKYPVCYAAHRIADGVLDLAHANELRPADVAAVDATLSETTAGVLRHHSPKTVDEARFSIEFIVAAAITHGRLGPTEVSAPTMAEPDVRKLMRHVRMHTVQSSCPIEPSFALHDRVTITLTNGVVLDSGDIRFARGHAQLPLSEAQLREKLFACAGPGERDLAEDILKRIDHALEQPT